MTSDITPPDGHTSGEIVNWIGTYHSQSTAAEIADALDPTTGFAQFRELTKGGLGRADSGTIAIRTAGTPLWLCALIMLHEWQHCTSAHSSNPNDPDKPDPNGTIADPTCGYCREAELQAEALDTLAQWACDPPALVPPAVACATAKDLWDAVGKAISLCAYAGCTSCCGFGYVPNAGELTQMPPCCP